MRLQVLYLPNLNKICIVPQSKQVFQMLLICASDPFLY